MPNPYDDLFGSEEHSSKPEDKNEEQSFGEFDLNDPFPAADDYTEALDEVLESIKQFQAKAAAFSKILTQTRAIDYKVESTISRLFFTSTRSFDQGSLNGERRFHAHLLKLFVGIIQPMKELAELHLQTVHQFNRDIDDAYYSIEKEDHEVKKEKKMAVKGINLQRKILGEASSDLNILKNALIDTERRLKKYIDAGGRNNISSSEVAIITAEREELSSGKQHQFNFSIFEINLLDKTVISFGGYMKETSAKYLKELSKAFEARK